MPATTTPARTALYGRVSLDRRDGRSVDQQLDAGRRWVLREGHRSVGEFRDDGVSASQYARTKVREDWVRVMEHIGAGQVDILWVWEVSRATRDRPVWAALLAACESHDVKIAVDGRLHDPNDPDDGFMLDLAAMLGVRESKVTRKRIIRDVKARAAAGRPHGRLAFGWRRVYDHRPNGTRVLVCQKPDPEIAPLIKEAAQRFADGEALYSIAQDFDRRGVRRPIDVRHERLEQEPPPPGRWDPNQVRRIISSPTNAGIRSHNGEEVVADAWEAIIPVELHRRIVAKLANPARRTHRDSEAAHLLTGIARCAICEAVLRRIKNRGSISYACSEKFCVSRKIEPVDHLVTETLLMRLERPDAAEVFEDDGEDDSERAQAARELAAARSEWNDLVAASEAGSISVLAFARLEPALVARIADAERRAAPAEPLPVVVTDLMSAPDVRKAWELASLSIKRQVISTLLEIRMKKSYIGKRVFDPTTVDIKFKR